MSVNWANKDWSEKMTVSKHHDYVLYNCNWMLIVLRYGFFWLLFYNNPYKEDKLFLSWLWNTLSYLPCNMDPPPPHTQSITPHTNESLWWHRLIWIRYNSSFQYIVWLHHTWKWNSQFWCWFIALFWIDWQCLLLNFKNSWTFGI